MDLEWRLLPEECTGCGICADVCGFDAIRMPREAPCPEGIPSECTGCLSCVEECPFGAILVREGVAV